MIDKLPRRAVLIILLLSVETMACSFAPGYQLFRFSETELIGTGEAPYAPAITVGSIKRGFDDGNPASCSDAGILTLVVEGYDPGDRTGFLFRLDAGSLGGTEFQDEILAPIELEKGVFGFRIVWLDWVKGQRTQTQISATLGVRAVSDTGVESEEVLVQVEHAGS